MFFSHGRREENSIRRRMRGKVCSYLPKCNSLLQQFFLFVSLSRCSESTLASWDRNYTHTLPKRTPVRIFLKYTGRTFYPENILFSAVTEINRWTGGKHFSALQCRGLLYCRKPLPSCCWVVSGQEWIGKWTWPWSMPNWEALVATQAGTAGRPLWQYKPALQATVHSFTSSICSPPPENW